MLGLSFFYNKIIPFKLAAKTSLSTDDSIHFNGDYVKFTSSNQTIPTGDWCLGGWIKYDDTALGIPVHFGSSSASGDSDNNLYIEVDGRYGTIGCYGRDSAGNYLGAKPSSWIDYKNVGIKSSYNLQRGVSVLVVIQKIGNKVQMWLKYDGHSPVLVAEENTSFDGITDTKLTFGQTASWSGKYNGAMRNWFKLSFTLTKNQIDQVGNGVAPETFGTTAANDWRFLMDSYGSHGYLWVDEINSLEASQYLSSGYSLVQGLGYASMTNPVFLDPIGMDGYVIQHINGNATINLSGTYLGDDDQDIEIQFFDDKDKGVKRWFTVDTAVSGGTWSGTVTLPKGKRWLFAQLRKKGYDDVVTTSIKVGIGENVMLSGQSLMAHMSSVAINEVNLNGYGSVYQSISNNSGRYTVSGAVNNSGEIELEFSERHGMRDNDKVIPVAINGTTEANNTVWEITVIDEHKITLNDSIFVNDYSSGGYVYHVNNHTKLPAQPEQEVAAPLAILANAISEQTNSVVCVANISFGGQAINQFNEYGISIGLNNYACYLNLTGQSMGRLGSFLWLHGHQNIGQTSYFSDGGTAGAWTGWGELGKLYDILKKDQPNDDFNFGVAAFTSVAGISYTSASNVHEFRFGMDDWVARKIANGETNVFPLRWYNDIQPKWENGVTQNAHLPPTLKGYFSQGARLAHSLAAKLGGVANDSSGGIIVSAAKAGNIIDVTVELNGGTSLKAYNDNYDITGFEVATDSDFTSKLDIKSARIISDNVVRITLKTYPSSPCYIRYQYGYVGDYNTSEYHTPRITDVTDNGSGLIRVKTEDPLPVATPSTSQKVGGHGVVTDQVIGIEGVAGAVQANGVWRATVIDSETIDLQSSDSSTLDDFIPNENLWQTDATGVIAIELGNPLYDNRIIGNFDTIGAPVAPTYNPIETVGGISLVYNDDPLVYNDEQLIYS